MRRSLGYGARAIGSQLPLRAAGLIGLAVLTTSIWAFDRTELDKKLQEMKDKDPKVRAAALAELASVYVDLETAYLATLSDTSVEVVAARQEFYQKRRAELQERIGKPFELQRSRMAANETAAFAACKAYVEAQAIYHRTDYAQTGTLAYAQHLKGDNSLLETKAGMKDLTLIDEVFANAEGDPGKTTPKAGKNDLELIDELFANAEGNPGKAAPKAGYCFKILTKQGANAPGGAKDYIVNGKMTLGYALIAYPAEYGKTGSNCFMIDNTGRIYQKDLGADTPKIVEKMTEFDPDKTWTAVK